MKEKGKYLVSVILVLVFIMSLVGCTASDPLVFGDLPSSEDLYAQGNVHLDGDVDITGDYTVNGVPISGGSGVDEFTELTDAPNSYVDQSGKVVAVKSTEDGLEFVDASTGSTSNAFKNNPATTSGLMYGYFGGTFIFENTNGIRINGTPEDGTIELVNDAWNIVFIGIGEGYYIGCETSTENLPSSCIQIAAVLAESGSIIEIVDLITNDTYSKYFDVFSGSSNGLVPGPSEVVGAYLKDDGTWDTPAGGSYTLPEASESYRGKFYTVYSESESADITYVCLKNSSNEYVWVQLATGDD
jgi:hypothetical protein